MDSKDLIQSKWINTPFSYTRISKNLTLLQQAVLVKVSEHLQPYIKEFFGSDLCKSKKVPRGLFSEAVKNSGILQFSISYAELGVSINNYYSAAKAVEEVLKIQVDAPGKDENGKDAMIKYNVFTQGSMSSDNNTGVVFGLNPDVVDRVFDMSQDYVSHPDNIALIGEVERMPMIYYLLRVSSGHKWNNRIVDLTVNKIKEYLGMITWANGRVLKEAYPKYSQFRKKVIETSIDDINRLKRKGLLDVCVSFEPVYNGKRKVGNPAFIRFRIFNTIEEMEKSTMVEGTNQLFAGNNPAIPPEPKVKDYPGQWAAQWQALIEQYNGALKPFLLQAQHYGASEAGFMSIRFADKQTLDAFNAACNAPQNKQDYEEMMRLLASLIGPNYARILVRGVK